MIPTKPMAVVAVLALAGGLIGQQKLADRPTTLPRLAKLLEELPQPGLELQNQTYEARARLRSCDATLARIGSKHKAYQSVRRALRSTCSIFLQHLAEDYSRIRDEGHSATVPMLQILLLTRLSCAKPEADFLRWPGEVVLRGVDLREVADELLESGETQEERLLGHLYDLHEGAPESRIRSALLLAQMEDSVTEIVPHLVEELRDADERMVQEAITTLGLIGSTAKDAVPSLEKLAEHDDRRIAETAKAALRQIKGDL